MKLNFKEDFKIKILDATTAKKSIFGFLIVRNFSFSNNTNAQKFHTNFNRKSQTLIENKYLKQLVPVQLLHN